MITLDGLKELGCISVDYAEVDYHNNKSASYSEVISWSEKKQSRFNGVVICDNCLWAATLKKIPLIKATRVYTSDGAGVYLWDNEKRSLFIYSLTDKKLVLVSQIKIAKYKEEKNMADIKDVNLDNLDLTAMNAFGGANDAAAPATGTKESATSLANKAFKEKIEREGIAVTENTSIAINNLKYGRCLGFITKTDRTVRMSLSRVAKKGADGKEILNAEGAADKAVEAAYNEYVSGVDGAKRPAIKYLEIEYDFKFRESKPGKVVGIILSIPASTADIDYTALLNGEGKVDSNSSKGEAVVRVLPIEQAYDYLINAFDGRIMESEEILGKRAAWLEVRGVVVTEKNSSSVTGDNVRYSLRLAQKSETRKTLLTSGNYIPAKAYKALSQNEISSEADAASLNNNVKQLLAKGDKKAMLSDNAKSLLVDDGEGIKYFSVSGAGRPNIPAPAAFDGSGDLTSVRVAIRDAKQTKSGTNTYPFVYEDDMSSIFAQAGVKRIMEVAGLTQESVQSYIKELTKTTSKAKTGSRQLSSLDLDTLKKYSRTKDSKSVKELAQRLAGLTA